MRLSNIIITMLVLLSCKQKNTNSSEVKIDSIAVQRIASKTVNKAIDSVSVVMPDWQKGKLNLILNEFEGFKKTQISFGLELVNLDLELESLSTGLGELNLSMTGYEGKTAAATVTLNSLSKEVNSLKASVASIASSQATIMASQAKITAAQTAISKKLDSSVNVVDKSFLSVNLRDFKIEQIAGKKVMSIIRQ